MPPYSARPGVTVAVAADTAASQNQASSQSSAAAAAIRPRPASAAATSAAERRFQQRLAMRELHSAGQGDGGTPAAASPRAMRETWTPGVRAWSDWSVGNAAYPKLAERSSAAVAGPAARCRYAIIAADSPREHRFKPSKTPVTVKRSWGDAEYVPLAPVSAVPPPPPPSSRVRVVGAQGASTSTSGSQQEAAEGSVGADGGGGGVGGGKMGGGLSAMFGKAKHGKAKMSLKTLAKLSSTLTGVQARAQAKERERTIAEREAHYASLRTALGTALDYSQPFVPSTATAIEATMAEELRRAMPKKKDRSPSHLRRSIDTLNKRLEAKPSTPKSKGRPVYMRQTSERRGSGRFGGSGRLDVGGSGRFDVEKSAPTSSLRSATRPITPRQHSTGSNLGAAPPSSARHASASGPSSPEKQPPHPPLSATASAKGGSARFAMGSAKFVDDSGESLEALPMPTPRGFGGRRRSHQRLTKPVSALDSAQEHTAELQEALAAAAPLLKRSSLRRLVARILEDPALLPPGALEGEGDEDPTGESKRSLEALLAGGDEDEPEYS